MSFDDLCDRPTGEVLRTATNQMCSDDGQDTYESEMVARDLQVAMRPTLASSAAPSSTSQPAAKRKSHKAGKVVRLGLLFLGLFCLAALLIGLYRADSAPTRPIEEVRVGDPVVVDAPREAMATDIARLSGRQINWNEGELEVEGVADPLRELTDASIEQIKSADYRLIKIRAIDEWPDGTVDFINVETLQSYQDHVAAIATAHGKDARGIRVETSACEGQPPGASLDRRVLRRPL